MSDVSARRLELATMWHRACNRVILAGLVAALGLPIFVLVAHSQLTHGELVALWTGAFVGLWAVIAGWLSQRSVDKKFGAPSSARPPHEPFGGDS